MKYRAVAADAYRVDAGVTLLAVESAQTGTVVETLAAGVLRHCLAERTLADHVEHLAGVVRIADRQEVVSSLEALVARGLLRPVAVAPTPTGGLTEEASHQSIDTVAIVTADRPVPFERCLRSYTNHLAEWRRPTRVLVVDTSREAANQQETERIVTDFRGERDIQYLAAPSRRAIRQRAVARGVPPSVLDWLMPESPNRRSAGGARNHLLLATVGQRVLTADDDTVCTPWGPGTTKDGIAFVGHVDPRETTFFPTRRDALDAVRPANVNLLASHEALLGWPLEQLAGRCRGHLDLNAVCQHFLPALDGGRPDWMVRATWTGIAGDAAVYCPSNSLFVSGATRERMAASEEAFRLALGSREVVRAVSRATVVDEPWFMTYCAGIDNTSLLPPFDPFVANEDGLFAAMLRMCDPAAFVAQVPCGIVHDSHRASAYPVGAMRSASEIRLADLVQWISEPWASANVSSDPAVRLRGLGDHLRECGRMKPRPWQAHVLALVVRAKRQLLLAGESVLANGYPYPPYWRAAIRRYQQAVLDSVATPHVTVPVELDDSPTVEQAMLRLQTHLAAFGEALVVWPDLLTLQRESAIDDHGG